MNKKSAKLNALKNNNETLFLDLGDRWIQAYAVERIGDEDEELFRIEAGFRYMPADWKQDGTFEEIVAEMRKLKDLRSWVYRTW